MLLSPNFYFVHVRPILDPRVVYGPVVYKYKFIIS